MADVAILTALYGGYDSLRSQVAQDIDVDWVCFTDQAHAPEPWTVVSEPPRYDTPIMAAKLHKLRPRAKQRFVVWIDANTEITSPSFAREAIAAVHHGVAFFRHPRRDCIYSEASASLGAESQGGRYDHLPVREQMAHYRERGHPEHWGLWAGGTVVWDREDPRSRVVGSEWLSECERWGHQDQLSLPVVLRRWAIQPGVFRHRQITRRRNGYLENPWQRLHPHLSA